MIGKALKLFGLQNKIDLSPSGLDDLKIVGFLLSIFVGIFFGLIIPWMYGLIQIIILIVR